VGWQRLHIPKEATCLAMYQIPSAVVPAITSVQENMKRLGLFKDKVNGRPLISTWEAVESALRELETLRQLNEPKDAVEKLFTKKTAWR